MLFIYIFDTPFLFETALAEEVTSEEANDKKADSANKTTKSYSDLLWEYRWYVLGTSLFILSSLALTFYIFSGPVVEVPPTVAPPTAPVLMPHIPGQTITDLIAVKPTVCIDTTFSKAMPNVLSVDSHFFHLDPTSVVDPNFIKGFRVGTDLYQVYLMPESVYDDLSKDFWIQAAQNQFGKVVFQSPDVTFLYTKVAVIPVDAVNYTVYHKVDLVKIIQDPGHPSIPRILTSYLFKDNESGWFQ